MVEAETLVSSCYPKICYKSFCQHELFEVVGDSLTFFMAKNNLETYLIFHHLLSKKIQIPASIDKKKRDYGTLGRGEALGN